MNENDLLSLSNKIGYITINPNGNFLKSIQLGFKEVGLFPQHLIYVRPTNRLQKEFKKYKISFFTKFLLPQFLRFFSNKKSFANELVDIKIPNTHITSLLNSDKTIEIIQSLGIKYLINCGAGIFRKQIIEIPDLFILNAHAGKFPDYKNMNVVEWAILNGDKVVGTVHRIDEGIDTGPIWLEEEIDTSSALSLIEARELSFDHVAKMVGKAVILFENGKIEPKYCSPDQGRNWYEMHSYFKNQVNDILLNNRAYQ